MGTKRQNSKKGFTLVELIVAIAIIALVFPAISSTFINALKNTKDENSKLDTMAQAKAIIQIIKKQGNAGIDGLYNNTIMIKNNGKITIEIDYDDLDTLVGDKGLLNLPEITDNNYTALLSKLKNDKPITTGTGYQAIINIIPCTYNNSVTSVAFSYFPTYKVEVTVSDLKNNGINSVTTVYIGG